MRVRLLNRVSRCLRKDPETGLSLIANDGPRVSVDLFVNTRSWLAPSAMRVGMIPVSFAEIVHSYSLSV